MRASPAGQPLSLASWRRSDIDQERLVLVVVAPGRHSGGVSAGRYDRPGAISTRRPGSRDASTAHSPAAISARPAGQAT